MPRVKMFALNPAQQNAVKYLTARMLWDGEKPEAEVGAAVTVKGNTFMLSEDGTATIIATDPVVGDQEAAERAMSLVEDMKEDSAEPVAKPRGRATAKKS